MPYAGIYKAFSLLKWLKTIYSPAQWQRLGEKFNLMTLGVRGLFKKKSGYQR